MHCSIRFLIFAIVFFPSAVTVDDATKPGEFTLVNKAKDIRVIAGRDEPIADYFRGNRILVGGVVPEELNKLLQTKEPLAKFFVNYASQNDDQAKASTFGAYLDVAPPSAGVVKLIDKHKPDGKKALSLTLILRLDAKKPGLYHLVGCTERTPVGFFDNDKKNPTDGFSQKDLCFKGEPKK